MSSHFFFSRFKLIKINFLQVVCVLNGFFVLIEIIYARIRTLRIEMTFLPAIGFFQSFFTHYLQFLTLLFLPQFLVVFFLSLITSPLVVLWAEEIILCAEIIIFYGNFSAARQRSAEWESMERKNSSDGGKGLFSLRKIYSYKLYAIIFNS